MAQKTNVVSMPQRPSGIGIRPIARDFRHPYVVAHGGYTAGQQLVLQGTNDDLEREIDLRTYDRMDNDATIIKCKRIIITGTLVDELQLAPGATESEVGEEEYQVYEKIMGHCQRIIDGLDQPYRETMSQLLNNALKYGHGIAETEWDYRMDGDSPQPTKKLDAGGSKVTSMWKRFGYYFGLGQTAPESKTADSVLKRPTLNSEKMRLMPTSIKVKPREATRFVVDDFMNVVGLTPRFRTGTNLLWNEIIDRDKFLVLTINKQDEDPRGKSTYRPAFNWYNIKGQLPSEILRLVLEEIVPKAVAIMAENAQPFELKTDENDVPVLDDNGNQVFVSAVDSIKHIIENFRSGSGAVFPHGTVFGPFKGTSGTGTDADLVAKIIKILDDQMEFAILHQTLAQSEGEHQARSASQQVAEILHNLIFWTRWLLGMMTLTNLFEVSVRMNYGEWAIKYLPKVSLGDFIRRDWGADLGQLADAYFKGFIDDTQRADLMAWMNLPPPGPSRQEVTAQAVAKQDVNGQPIQPNTNRPDKKAGSNRNNGNGTEKKNAQQTTGLGLGNALGHHRRGNGFIAKHLFTGRK